jgi:hypothetical protein
MPKGIRKEEKGDLRPSYRIGGAQLATITFLEPTSLAICMISFDVVPRTMESLYNEYWKTIGRVMYLPSTMRTFLSANSSAIAFNLRRTFFFLYQIYIIRKENLAWLSAFTSSVGQA